MSNNSSTTATDVLGHTDFGVLNLCLASLTAQLLNTFNNLINACRTNRMSARF
jgi:hypothetical protein